MDKFSIIIPIYNTEKYLAECIDSVINQSYQNIEIILINDGSPLNADEICNEYIKKDSRIKYFSKQNEGVAIARNFGISKATGDYIFCMDSDDTIQNDFIEILAKTASKNYADLIIIGESLCPKRMEILGALPTWGFVVKKDMLDKYQDVRFIEGMQPCEDGLFSHKLLALSGKISKCPDAVYNYRNHENSSEHSLHTKKIIHDMPIWFDILEKFYNKYNLWDTHKLHLLAFIENEPYSLRFCKMNFSEDERKYIFDLIHDFINNHKLLNCSKIYLFRKEYRNFLSQKQYSAYKIAIQNIVDKKFYRKDGIMKSFKYQFYRFMCNITFGRIKKFYKNKKNAMIFPNRKVFDYNHLRSNGRKARENNEFELNNIGLTLYHTLNKMKELELKRKIREGKKVKVLFLLDQPSKLASINVYKNMLESDLFNPFIVLYNNLDEFFLTDSVIYNNHKNGLEHLLKKGYKIFDGYDSNNNIIPIENFKPDIIFTSAPYLDYSYTSLTNTYMNLNYLVCYLPYFFGTINAYDYLYNNRRIASCWKNFVSSRDDYNELSKYSQFCGSNAVLVGYPKLDDYTKPIEECKIYKKIDNCKPIVIYAPHHSVGDDENFVNYGSFHIYNKYFLDLVKNNNDINFVFKPHPDLSKKVVEKGIMSIKEYQDYIKAWDSLPNGLYVPDGDYIDLFRKADLLIQDCCSFIAEWLPTNKPCMYLVRPECKHETFMSVYSTIGRKILDEYYLCHNKTEIDKYFRMIMLDKQDPMKEERCKLKDELFINIGCAGKKVVEYLENVLTD